MTGNNAGSVANPTSDTADYFASTSNPIKLLTPVTLKAHTTIAILSEAPVSVCFGSRLMPASHISATSPIQVISPWKATIAPCLPLGSGFVQGWNKIPTELKIRILDFNLTQDIPVDASAMSEALSPELPSSRPPCVCMTKEAIRLGERDKDGVALNYFSHIRSTPEIASLSPEIFYSKNVFLVESKLHGLRAATGSYTAITLAYPPLSVNKFVRRLMVRLQIGTLQWRWLVHLATGTHGFSNLKELTMELDLLHFALRHHRAEDTRAYFVAELTNIVGDGIEIFCNGQLTFNANDRLGRGIERISPHKDYLEGWLRERIIFNGN